MVEKRRGNYIPLLLYPQNVPPHIPPVEPPLPQMAEIEHEVPLHPEEEQPQEDEQDAVPTAPQGNRPLPRDVSKLPTLQGDEKDVQQIETFLIDLNRYCRINAACFRQYPGTPIKLGTIAQCFPFTSLARAWYDTAERSFRSYAESVTGFRANFAAGEANLLELQRQWEQPVRAGTAHETFIISC